MREWDKVSTLHVDLDLVMPAPDDKARNLKTSGGPTYHIYIFAPSIAINPFTTSTDEP